MSGGPAPGVGAPTEAFLRELALQGAEELADAGPVEVLTWT